MRAVRGVLLEVIDDFGAILRPEHDALTEGRVAGDELKERLATRRP